MQACGLGEKCCQNGGQVRLGSLTTNGVKHVVIDGTKVEVIGIDLEGDVLVKSEDGTVYSMSVDTMVTVCKEDTKAGYRPLTADEMYSLFEKNVVIHGKPYGDVLSYRVIGFDPSSPATVATEGFQLDAEDLLEGWFFDRACTVPVGIRV